MNQATNVNIVPSYGQRGDLHFSQYDVGRTATINLYAVNEAYTIPVGATVKIQATKPSGLGFDVACTFSGSVVTVVSTETMTEEAGRFPCELRITKDSDVIGTANFMFVVEASPHPDGVIDGDAEEVVNEIKALVLESEGYALGTQDGVPVDSSSVYYHNNAKWLSDNAVLSDEVKQTLLACFEKVAWIDGNGQTYYNALQSALNRGAELLSISAVYTQSGTVYETDSLDSLKADLVVTAHYDDSSEETVLAYTLSGTLTAGTSTITVSYLGKTTTFSVTVTAWTLKWDYNDNGLPASVAPNDWTASIATVSNPTTTATFENGKGIKFYGRGGSYTITPKNYQTTQNGVMEIVVNFAEVTQEAYDTFNVRATLNTASDTLIGFFFKNGVKVNGSGSDYQFIPNTEIQIGDDHVLRVERNNNAGKVYLDGTEVYSGELRTLSGTNNVLMSFTSNLTTGTHITAYMKAIRFLHIS